MASQILHSTCIKGLRDSQCQADPSRVLYIRQEINYFCRDKSKSNKVNVPFSLSTFCAAIFIFSPAIFAASKSICLSAQILALYDVCSLPGSVSGLSVKNQMFLQRGNQNTWTNGNYGAKKGAVEYPFRCRLGSMLRDCSVWKMCALIKQLCKYLFWKFERHEYALFIGCNLWWLGIDVRFQVVYL